MGPAPVPLRRNRDFLLLWTGEFVSTLGARVSFVAFPLLVLATTGSPARAGIVGAASWLPVLILYLPAGVLVDRVNRGSIMLGCNLVGAVALGSIPAVAAAGALTFGQIAAVAFLQGSVTVVFSLAEQGALPLVVAEDQLPEALARNATRTSTAELAGPPLGGILFAVSRPFPFLVDAISYLASAAGVALIRRDLQEPRTRASRRMRPEIAEGMRALWAMPFVRASALAVAADNLTWAALEIVLVVRAREDGASSAAVGVMFALVAAGGLAGSLTAPAIVRRLPRPVVVLGSFWLDVPVLALMALTSDALLLGLLGALAASSAPAWNAIVVSERLMQTPDPLRGRVNSVARLVSGSLLAAGALGAGLVIAATSTTATLLFLVLWQCGLAVVSTSARTLRESPPRRLSV